MLLAIQKLPYIQIAIGIDLHAFPILLVAAKIALVQSPIFADRNALPLSLLARYLPKINLAIAFDQLQIFTL